MNMHTLLRSLVRRRYLVLLGLVVVAALGVATYQLVPPTYTARASAMLLPPDATVPPEQNPYLYLDGLNPALDVLARSLGDESTRAPILQGNPALNYVVEPDRTTAGPILLIESTGPSPDTTLGVLHDVLEVIPANLANLQESLGVAPSSQITSTTLTTDPSAQTVGKTRLRAVIAVVAVGAAASALLIGLLDGMLLAREDAKHVKTAADDEAAPVEPPQEPARAEQTPPEGRTPDQAETEELERIDSTIVRVAGEP